MTTAKTEHRRVMRRLRLWGVDEAPAGTPSAVTFALRNRKHDMLAENATLPQGDPLWVRKALSRMRRASIAIYGGVNGRRNLP